MSAKAALSSLSSSQRGRVLAAYRGLARARRILFKGDTAALQQSRIALRQEFLKHNRRLVDPSANANGGAGAQEEQPSFESLLAAAAEAEDMLLHGLVQGKLNDDSGHYEVKFRPEHARNMEDYATVEPVTEDTVTKLHQQQQQQEDASCAQSAPADVVVEKTTSASSLK